MFDEIVQTLAEFRKHIQGVSRIIAFGGVYFYTLALVDAYNHMIFLADTRTQDHPEVERVPELRLLLVQHFIENADKHINIYGGTILDEALLGGPRTLREWQEAGYHTRRSQSNYQKRLRYWKSLYDDAPVTFQQRVTADNIFGQVAYQSSFASKRGIPSRPKNKTTGALVTYEEVIHARNTNYGTLLVPWWRVLNYGTGGQGYPISPGLHFVEDAERTIPAITARYADIFEQFAADSIDADFAEDQHAVESWARAHVQQQEQEYVPAFDIARIKAFGVPF